MSKRLIPVNIIEAKKVKKLVTKARNNTERKRISIVVLYLGGMNMTKVSNYLMAGKTTVVDVINSYKKFPEGFYKTHWIGRVENEENREYKEQINDLLEKSMINKDQIDINDVRVELEKKNKKNLPYWKVHWLVRKKLGLNYQKPYVTSNKQSKYAKSIAEGRLRKAIYQIGLEEGEIDAESVKNKKTKFGEFS